MKELKKYLLSNWVWILIGFVLLAIAYYRALGSPFIWDDHLLIEQNPAVLETGAWKKIFHQNFWDLPYIKRNSNGFYRPMIIASFVSDAQTWGLNPFGFHLTNLVFHFANCLLVFVLVKRSGTPTHIAALSMVLFGAMPRLTESATWIAGRTDLLACFGAASSLALYAHRPTDWRWRTASALALLFGLFSKEVALAALPALIAYEWSSTRETQKNVKSAVSNTILRLIPALCVTALYFFLRLQIAISIKTPMTLTPLKHVGIVLQALGTYFWMLLTPLAPHLAIGTTGIFETWKIVLGALLLPGIFIAGFLVLRRTLSPLKASLLSFGIVAILPVLHLGMRPLVSDRFLYLPWFGLCAFLFSNWKKIPEVTQKYVAMACGLIALSFVWGAHQRNFLWQDEVRLWQSTAEHALAISPKNGAPHCELATALTHRGKFRESLEHYERCHNLEKEFQNLYPDYRMPTPALANWALTLSTLGINLEQAVRISRYAAEAKPNEASYRFFCAVVLSRALRFEEADQEFHVALTLYPNYSEAQTARQQTRQAAKIWNQLPPENENELLEIRGQRGIVYFLVGRIADANRTWIEIVNAPSADAKILKKARSILQHQQRVFGNTAETQALGAAIANRERLLSQGASSVIVPEKMSTEARPKVER